MVCGAASCSSECHIVYENRWPPCHHNIAMLTCVFFCWFGSGMRLSIDQQQQIHVMSIVLEPRSANLLQGTFWNLLFLYGFVVFSMFSVSALFLLPTWFFNARGGWQLPLRIDYEVFRPCRTTQKSASRVHVFLMFSLRFQLHRFPGCFFVVRCPCIRVTWGRMSQ